MRYLAEGLELCDVGRLLVSLGLIGAAEGNLSVRVAQNLILTTPSGVSKGSLKPIDLVLVDLDGKPVHHGKPSSEILLHTVCYQARADCQAVIHAHPPTATAFALAGETIPSHLMPEAMVVLGPVALARFAMPGTNEVPDSVQPLLNDHKTILMSHHGAVVMGKNLRDACERMETLERVARVLVTARQLGGEQPMPAAAVESLVPRTLHGRF